MKPTRLTAWMFAVLLLVGAMAVPAQAANDPGEDLASFNPVLTGVAEQCRLATVGIVIPGGSMGSGVIISEDGLILTAAHVLPEAGGEVVIVLADGRQVAGKALGVNRGVDSGMAQITEEGIYPTAAIADSNTIWEGDWCIAFGHGGGVQTDRPAYMRLGRMLHVTSDTKPTRWLTTDCTVISGDSGGPLFDLQGRVIGIHSNIGMNVLVNRHVPISAYHAQWDELAEAGKEISNPPPPKAPLIPGLDTLPEALEREIARRLNDNDDELKQELEGLRDENGRIELSPEQAATLLGREDLIEEVRAYQEKLAERIRRTEEIENANGDTKTDKKPSTVSKRSEITRMMILEKKRERMLDSIAEDLRKTHGKIAPHVLARFEPAVSSAGANTVEIICRGKVVALGTVIREDGYIVTKASELVGPTRVRIGENEVMARVVNGNGPNDLALLKIDADNLTAIRWASESPALGSLLVVPGPDQRPLAMAVVSVDARMIPQRVNNVRVEPPAKAFLGISEFEADDEAGGVRVGKVAPDAAAANAGLQDGDLITQLNGQATTSAADIVRVIQEAKVGDTVKLTVQRGEETLELQATLGKRPAAPKQARDDRKSAAQVYSARAGKLSERRTDFPLAITHDAVIWAPQIGGPVLNTDGQAIGINIARYGRTSTYALPAEHAKQAIDTMMRGR